jgi:hypothetical protein
MTRRALTVYPDSKDHAEWLDSWRDVVGQCILAIAFVAILVVADTKFGDWVTLIPFGLIAVSLAVRGFVWLNRRQVGD